MDTMTDQHYQELVDFLRFSVEGRVKLGIEIEGFHYVCMEDFVLQHGEKFDHISPRADRYMQRPMKACFWNSYDLAWRSRGKLRYVEGYAHGRIMPVHHAWCIDEHGGVVDKTWPDVGLAYLGIIFPTEYVRATQTDDNLCMLDRWEEGWPLLRQPFNGIETLNV